MTVIAAELDRTYYGIEFVNSFYEMQTEELIHKKLAEYQRGYKFLIFSGEGDTINGIPSILKTRFKNRIHRSIYLELHYHGNNEGVIANCHYCDRVYKERLKH